MPANLPILASSSAPAILDVMGGISDIFGGLCLGYALAITTECLITSRDSSGIRASFNGSAPIEITKNKRPYWAKIVANALADLPDELVLPGLEIEIVSDIPRDAGLNEQSALEIAVSKALNRAFDLSWTAPTATAAFPTILARANHLSVVKFQPASIKYYVPLPDGLELWAIDSGLPQSAGRSAYEIALCAAKIGAILLGEIVPNQMRGPDGELYLANISADIWRALRPKIPEKLSGAQFSERHQALPDLEKDRLYNVRLATEHPIYENDRSMRFAHLLRAINDNPAARIELGRAAGELMVQSHFSTDHRCNLNSPATDLLVELARAIGPKRGIYGAKITGRGGGGCIALLCDRHANSDLESAFDEICANYREQSGGEAQVYQGL